VDTVAVDDGEGVIVADIDADGLMLELELADAVRVGEADAVVLPVPLPGVGDGDADLDANEDWEGLREGLREAVSVGDALLVAEGLMEGLGLGEDEKEGVNDAAGAAIFYKTHREEGSTNATVGVRRRGADKQLSDGQLSDGASATRGMEAAHTEVDTRRKICVGHLIDGAVGARGAARREGHLTGAAALQCHACQVREMG
jgi:hypothetical protein